MSHRHSSISQLSSFWLLVTSSHSSCDGILQGEDSCYRQFCVLSPRCIVLSPKTCSKMSHCHYTYKFWDLGCKTFLKSEWPWQHVLSKYKQESTHNFPHIWSGATSFSILIAYIVVRVTNFELFSCAHTLKHIHAFNECHILFFFVVVFSESLHHHVLQSVLSLTQYIII